MAFMRPHLFKTVLVLSPTLWGGVKLEDTGQYEVTGAMFYGRRREGQRGPKDEVNHISNEDVELCMN